MRNLQEQKDVAEQSRMAYHWAMFDVVNQSEIDLQWLVEKQIAKEQKKLKEQNESINMEP